MALKGQKIRLFLNNKCVALCKTSSIHVAAQVEDVSTKDSDGDFAENEIVGLSWDASATAYVEPKKLENQITSSDFQDVIVRPTYYYPKKYSLKKGDIARAIGESSSAIIYDSDFNQLASAASSVSYVTYTATDDIDIYFGLTSVGSSSSLYMYDITYTSALEYEDILEAIKNKTVFEFEMNETTGGSNRVVQTAIIEGQCLITDVSCTAESRQRSTYQFQLTGIGELGIVEPEPDDQDDNDDENYELG